MTQFSERQRAELRDAAARSRLEALDESRRLAESSRVPSREQAGRTGVRPAEAPRDLGGGATGAQPGDGGVAQPSDRCRSATDAPQKRAETKCPTCAGLREVPDGDFHWQDCPTCACRSEVDEVLALPEAQEIIRRIGTAVDPDYPHRADHVKWVAAVVVKAKMQPTNAYAKATL